MTQAVARILEEAGRLSTEERAELVDRMVEKFTTQIPSEIAAAQISEVQRRIAQVEANSVVPIPAEEALAQVRAFIASAQPGV